MIIHVDMDAFYASVEIRDNPKLASLPVVVGGSPTGRGVVAAASYEARKFGIHSAMPSSQAIRLCPKLVFIKPRMDHYAGISRQIRDVFHSFTDQVEPLSLDEAFMDVTGSELLFGSAETIAKAIKQRIKSEIGLTASAGVAPNKFLAKVASDLEKPDGLVIVSPSEIQEFLDPLPISRVWGIGKQTQKKFDSLGVKTIQQLRQLPMTTLRAMFGLNSEHFWKLSRGEDTRRVVPDREAKSISHETTFYQDIDQIETLHAWMLELVDQVARRLRRYKIVGRTVQIKIRYSDFETITRSQTISEPTNTTQILVDVALELLHSSSQQIQRGIRLLGMGVSQLRESGYQQLSLFDDADEQRAKKMDAMGDTIRDKFGNGALTRGTNLAHNIHLRPDPDKKASPDKKDS
jgi:DNA polymerase IV